VGEGVGQSMCQVTFFDPFLNNNFPVMSCYSLEKTTYYLNDPLRWFPYMNKHNYLQIRTEYGKRMSEQKVSIHF